MLFVFSICTAVTFCTVYGTVYYKMVIIYKKKVGGRRYVIDRNEEELNEIIEKVRDGQLTQRRASALYNIPRSTLNNRLKMVHSKKHGHPTVFSEAEEKSLVKFIQTVGDWGFPLTLLDLKFVIKNYLDRAGRHVKCFKTNFPGSEWANTFLKRHYVELSQRLCQNIKAESGNYC